MPTKIHPQKPHRGLNWIREGHVTFQIDEHFKEVKGTRIAHLSPPITRNISKIHGVPEGTRIKSNSAAKRYMRGLA